MPLILSSTAFSHQGSIPARYTCEGRGYLAALIVVRRARGHPKFQPHRGRSRCARPEPPRMTWVHWVLYNLPASTRELPEGMTPQTLPTGTKEGQNNWKRTGYGGPCPPIGPLSSQAVRARHRSPRPPTADETPAAKGYGWARPGAR